MTSQTSTRRSIPGTVGRRRSVRLAVAGLGSLGLLLGTAGCGTDGVGADGPLAGSVAASVDGESISVDDVTNLVGAYCVSLEQDPAAASTGGGPRALIQEQILANWIQSLAAAELQDEIGYEDVPPPQEGEEIPGWAEMSADQRTALEKFMEDSRYLGAALQVLVPEGAADPQGEAFAGLAAAIEESGVDVTVNPRYRIEFVDGAVADSVPLAVPVDPAARAEADYVAELESALAAGREPDRTYVRSLPEDQLCGPRPPAAQPPGPLG